MYIHMYIWFLCASMSNCQNISHENPLPICGQRRVCWSIELYEPLSMQKKCSEWMWILASTDRNHGVRSSCFNTGVLYSILIYPETFQHLQCGMIDSSNRDRSMMLDVYCSWSLTQVFDIVRPILAIVGSNFALHEIVNRMQILALKTSALATSGGSCFWFRHKRSVYLVSSALAIIGSM